LSAGGKSRPYPFAPALAINAMSTLSNPTVNNTEFDRPFNNVVGRSGPGIQDKGNLRMKGNGIFWLEEKAEAMIVLRAYTINNPGSSIIDTVFVCRSTGTLA